MEKNFNIHLNSKKNSESNINFLPPQQNQNPLPKIMREKVKKLDLGSINIRHSLKNENIQMENGNTNLQTNTKNSQVMTTKEILLENLLTKDYERLLEFVSYEDFFRDKMINLQNPYFYVPLSMKNKETANKENEIIANHTRERQDFAKKYLNIFSESRKVITQSNSVKSNKNIKK